MAHMYEQEADVVEESRDKAQLLVMSQYPQYTMPMPMLMCLCYLVIKITMSLLSVD